MSDPIRCIRCHRPVVYVRFVARETSGYQCPHCGVSFGPEILTRWTWGRYVGQFASAVVPWGRLPWCKD